jgi:hypothetical protein
METAVVPNLVVQGDLYIQGTKPTYSRSELTLETSQRFPIPWTAWRVWDALQTNLPGTAATDDLALIGGTFASASPAIQAGDLKAAGATTRYARCQVTLPFEYQAAQSVVIRARAEMITTVADTSCTIDFQAYRSNQAVGIGSDLVTTAATTMNSLTDANIDFTVDAATLLPGDLLDIRMAITCTDGATGTAVIPSVGAVEILCSLKG